MDLTFKIEQQVPAAKEVSIGTGTPASIGIEQSKLVTNITNNTIYNGNLNQVTHTGHGNIVFEVIENDVNSLVGAFEKIGIPFADANLLAEIVRKETPEGPGKPLGAGAKAWFASRISEAATIAWKMAVQSAMESAKGMIARYYGI